MVLVACEESQVVTKAFRDLGFVAYSCDLKPCSGGHPEWHIQDDALKVLGYADWRLLIAHPPCTFITTAGAHLMYPGGVLDEDRYEQGIEAAEFFMQFYNCNIPHKCIENPLPMKCLNLPRYDQIVYPYMFGSKFSKRTCLWLHNLFRLQPCDYSNKGIPCFKADWFMNGSGQDRQAARSRTDVFLARAMAEQFSWCLL